MAGIMTPKQFVKLTGDKSAKDFANAVLKELRENTKPPAENKEPSKSKEGTKKKGGE